MCECVNVHSIWAGTRGARREFAVIWEAERSVLLADK